MINSAKKPLSFQDNSDANFQPQNLAKKPVIMQVLPLLESGGVERGVVDIAKSLKNQGFEPIVVSGGGVLTYDLKEAKITHITLDIGSKNPLKIFLNIKKLQNLIVEHKVDLVHVRSRAPMWSAFYACKKTNTRLVSTVHGTYSLDLLGFKNSKIKKFYNQIMLRSDAIIAVSNFIKSYIEQNYEKQSDVEIDGKITVIQRGVDLQHFNASKVSKNRIIDLIKNWNIPEDKKIILMPARYTSWKGHEFLIDSLSKVKNDFFCIMIGSSHGHQAFRNKIEQKIIKENLAEKVRTIGLCKDISAAYKIADFVVCPSIKPEAFGRVAIEAQACSKPILATNIGGSLETIIDGETGFLVSPNDSDALAAAIDKILSLSKEEVESIGNKGRNHVEANFSNELMYQKTIALYQEVLAKPKISVE